MKNAPKTTNKKLKSCYYNARGLQYIISSDLWKNNDTWKKQTKFVIVNVQLCKSLYTISAHSTL